VLIQKTDKNKIIGVYTPLSYGFKGKGDAEKD
jgi:hypothetical protein